MTMKLEDVTIVTFDEPQEEQRFAQTFPHLPWWASAGLKPKRTYSVPQEERPKVVEFFNEYYGNTQAKVRTVIVNMLRELSPDTIAWKTTGRQYTAEELAREINEDTDIGRQYASDLLRVCRDFLARKARQE